MIKISIDDGHGAETAGKRTPKFADGTIMKENEFNKIVAGYLEVALKRCGFAVVQTSPENNDVPLSVRAKRANHANSDLHISVHANAAGTGWNNANGIETFVCDMGDKKTVQAAKYIQKEMVQATGLHDRGVKENPNLYILNSTKMPAVLVECGFMTNKKEAKLLRSDSYRRTIAEAICKGVCAYFGQAYKQTNKPQKEVYKMEQSKIIVDGKTYYINRILYDGNNYIKIRDIAELLGYQISSKGSIPVLIKKK